MIDYEIAFSRSMQTSHFLVEGRPQFFDTVGEAGAARSLPRKCGVILEVIRDDVVQGSDWTFTAQHRVDDRNDLPIRGRVAHARQR
jgi:hypothetical protein